MADIITNIEDRKITETGKRLSDYLELNEDDAQELSRLTINKLPNGKPQVLDMHNFEFFAKNFITVSDKEEKQDIYFNLFDQQKLLLKRMLHQFDEIEILQNVIPKSRQIGITTFMDSFEIQRGLCVDKTNGVLILHRSDFQRAQILSWKRKISTRLMKYMYLIMKNKALTCPSSSDIDGYLKAFMFGKNHEKNKVDKANSISFSLFNGTSFKAAVADDIRGHLSDITAGQRVDILRMTECSHYGLSLVNTSIKSVSAKRGFIITLESTLKGHKGALYELLDKYNILHLNQRGQDVNSMDFRKTDDWQFHFYNWLGDLKGSTVAHVPIDWKMPKDHIFELEKRNVDYRSMPREQQYWYSKGINMFNPLETFFHEEPINLQDSLFSIDAGNWFEPLMVEKAVGRKINELNIQHQIIWNNNCYIDVSMDLGFRKDKTIMVAGALSYDRTYDRVIGTIGDLHEIPSKKHYTNNKDWLFSIAKQFIDICIKYQKPLIRVFHIDFGGPNSPMFEEDLMNAILEVCAQYDIMTYGKDLIDNLHINKFENGTLSNDDLQYFPNKKNFLTRALVCLDYFSRSITAGCINIPRNTNLLEQIGRVEVVEEKGKLKEVGKNKGIKARKGSPDELDAVSMLFDLPFLYMRKQTVDMFSFDIKILSHSKIHAPHAILNETESLYKN